MINDNKIKFKVNQLRKHKILTNIKTSDLKAIFQTKK